MYLHFNPNDFMVYRFRATGELVAVITAERERIHHLLNHYNGRMEDIPAEETVNTFLFVRGRNLMVAQQTDESRRYPDHMFPNLPIGRRMPIRDLNPILLATVYAT